MSTSLFSPQPCSRCLATGPALVPVRYAVVTDKVQFPLPAWAEPEITFPDEGSGFRYGLRTLRQGFVYVYYEKSRQWDGWAVAEDGSLWKQPSGAYAQPKKAPDCTAPEHNATNVEMIILRPEALSGNTWLAFSPSKWYTDTLDRYAGNEQDRKARMQCIATWQWAEPENKHGVAQATQANLNTVLDYAPFSSSHPAALMPFDPPVKRLCFTQPESPWYRFNESDICPKGTIYPWSNNRAGMAGRTVEALAQRGSGLTPLGRPIKPLLVALYDPAGITHELAGFADDYTALHKSWVDELSIEFMTDRWLSGVENQLRELNRAQALQDAIYNTGLIDAMTQGHRNEQDTARLHDNIRLNAIKSADSQFAHDWGKYAAELNPQKRKAFLDCHNRFCDVLAQQLEALASFRVAWLKNAHFITCSQDFASERVEDNLSYQEMVDYAMASLNLTQTGTAWLDEQIDRYSAGPKDNLVWRSLMLNNQSVIDETQPFLEGLAQHKGNPQKADQAQFLALVTSLSGKFVKAYDKANAAVAKNPTPSSSWSKMMLHCDRKMTTLGDRFFSFTRLDKVLDTMTEVLHKTLFSVMSGVAFDDAVRLSVSQLEDGNAFRQSVLDSLKASGGEERSTKLYEYKNRFDEFAQTDEGCSALKKSRIKLLVLAFNLLEYADKLHKLENDTTSKKAWAQYFGATSSTLGTAADIVQPVFEFGIKSDGWLKGIKWTGASAGSVASLISLGLDITSAIEEASGKQRWQYFALYTVKIIVDAKIAANALNGLFKLIIEKGWRLDERLAFKGIMWLAAWEEIAWLASWEVMIAIFIVEQLYTVFFGNDLQKWCAQSVFGGNPAEDLKSTWVLELPARRNKVLEQQQESFDTAMQVIQ
ncbi:T6SS effector BTH_I2691 family protein [Cronobacter sakazakii]|uniref:T6SS effector BTH_I2691 family protein n=3 Tax=Cronobacter sakazakii TaxID=28141 RepID=UPI0011E5A9AF|nr:T6SS effector BTH_I2691 family protein [Cronobacter sakazakii]EKF1803007.1 hypothetical protein [Cronobacter sakazakii]EKY2022532.1 hypothetical protein [Cronobacter sakazakii]EKY2074043.1 hypothetical protein [Cronobacter sakazakii]EKY2086265.1 hypothetical protein [Cronobacter sakazakii]ELY3798699.1 hypothetical protein [Cronobacter sakazakii]